MDRGERTNWGIMNESIGWLLVFFRSATDAYMGGGVLSGLWEANSSTYLTKYLHVLTIPDLTFKFFLFSRPGLLVFSCLQGEVISTGGFCSTFIWRDAGRVEARSVSKLKLRETVLNVNQYILFVHVKIRIMVQGLR